MMCVFGFISRKHLLKIITVISRQYVMYMHVSLDFRLCKRSVGIDLKKKGEIATSAKQLIVPK